MNRASAHLRRLTLLALVPLLAVAGCTTALGSGVARTEERAIAPFHKVDVSGSLTVDITRGSPQRVAIDADDNLLPYFRSEVRDDTLVLYTRENVRPTRTIHVTITAPDIRAVELSGSSHVTVHGVEGQNFELSSSGSSEVRLDDVALSGKLSVDSSGSGHVIARGRAEIVDIDSSGSSDIDTIGVAASDVHVEASGSGDFKVQAKDKLAVDISGSATVRYMGKPQVQFEQSGSGSIRAIE